MGLFNPIVEDARQHENFRRLLRIGNGFNLDVLNNWASGFTNRDGKFVEEFQTTFNSSFWELYLFAVLKKYGMPVDFSKTRPDFCIPSLNFNIEATHCIQRTRCRTGTCTDRQDTATRPQRLQSADYPTPVQQLGDKAPQVCRVVRDARPRK